MKHLGDITEISGYDAPIVNVVIGGSPCQDLSVAGKRAGLSGERSGLFMEQIRIIKEMRDKDARTGRTGDDVRPRFMVWENVPGAFSVNKGADFAAVLEETIRVAEPEAPDIPVPRKGWPTAGCYMGDGWSVAWRVLDAQYWGVPQRRRRIALVADFGGQTAPEILFKPKSVSGHFEPCGAQGQGTARNVENGIGDAMPIILMIATRDKALGRGTGFGLGENGDAAYTISANHEHAVAYGICSYASNSMKSDNPQSGIYEADTSRMLDNNGGNPACNQGGIAIVEQSVSFQERAGCAGGGKGILIQDEHTGALSTLQNQYVVYENHSQDSRYKDLGNISETVSAKYGTGGNNTPLVLSIGNGQTNCVSMSEVANPLDCMHDHQSMMIAGYKGLGEYQETETGKTLLKSDDVTTNDLVCAAVDCRNGTENQNTNGTLQAKSNGGVSYNLQNVVREGYIVRRLTPTECERLQGFPDGWTDIGDWLDSTGKKRKCSDSARYKALGNSIAIPPWLWVCDQIGQYLGEDKTMASLFDGIGGFPLIWSYLYGKETVLWASEIEEFPIAVTKLRFPDDKEDTPRL